MNWEPLLASICQELKSGVVLEGIEKEEHFERQFVEEIVRRCVASHPSHRDLKVATHPWTKPDTDKPHSAELRCKIKCWKDCKEWANVEAWGMRHTLDMFVWDKTTDDHECIAVEIKFCKVKTGRMPTGEFQRMLGQSLLFLGPQNHKAVISVFGFRGDASGALQDNVMEEFLRSIGVWPVVLRVP
ncbi:MAG TPA: hypothetical protein VIP09_14565 [Dehalococcoidia bacterium]|jgi:hypothetical protein